LCCIKGSWSDSNSYTSSQGYGPWAHLSGQTTIFFTSFDSPNITINGTNLHKNNVQEQANYKRLSKWKLKVAETVEPYHLTIIESPSYLYAFLQTGCQNSQFQQWFNSIHQY
jgi:hypothetical protein